MISRPFLISVGFHLVFALLAVFGLPMLGRDLPEEMPLVRLEIVRDVPETNLIEGDRPNTAKQAQEATVAKKPPPPPPPPPPRPARSEPPPPPPEPEPDVEPEAPAEDPAAEILPETPVPKPKPTKVQIPKPKPKPVAKPAPKPKPVTKPVSKPKRPTRPAPPVSKPTPKPKPVETASPVPAPPLKSDANEAVANQVNKLVNDNRKRSDAASGVLQNLAEAKVASEDAEEARKTQERKVAADTVTKTLSDVVGNAVKSPPKKSLAPIGIDDITRIQQHVKQCWIPPLGARGNDTLIIDIFVSVDRDGTVIDARIMDEARWKSDRYFKASAVAVEQALRECSPLPIPPEKYDQFKEGLEIGFDQGFMSQTR